MAAEEEILAINRGVIFDKSISHYEVRAHQPYASATFNNNDEIRISVQHQGLCLLPSKCSLHITGKFAKLNGQTVAALSKLGNITICYLFEEIRYKLNDVEIDRNKNVGLTSLIKGNLSSQPGQKNSLCNAGWSDNGQQLYDDERNFHIFIPLKMLLGFAGDYQRILVNAKHQIVLTSANTDLNAMKQDPADPNEKICLIKIEWTIPYITVSDIRKVNLLNFITKDSAITLNFRSWKLYKYPLLPRTTKHVWVVKTSTQLGKPRYVILAFHTVRKNDATKDASKFGHCNLRNVKLFLNSQSYPYGNMNLDITHNQYALLYVMYKDFQVLYYGREVEPLLSKKQFLDTSPLIVIDGPNQNESLKSGPVDVHLEFESTQQFPADLSAYCLIIHDRIIEYKPLSGPVRKLM